MTTEHDVHVTRHNAATLMWVDLMKALALGWIFLNHLTERIFGDPYIGNPSTAWPPIEARIAQLQPLHGHGVWDIPLNLLRYVGWTGDQGVQLFLILSGFGLTWGLLNRRTDALDLRGFYVSRAGRIFPLWWAVHLLFLGVSLVLGTGIRPGDPSFYLSMAGIRVTPHLLYYFAPAWWFIGLLLQLYVVYPFLWRGLTRYGPLRLLAVATAAALLVRGAGLLLLPAGIDAWSRGAIFITRLPEFVLGISLAAWLHDKPAIADSQLRRPPTFLLGLAGYTLGTLLSLSLIGMTIAPFLLGAGAFLVLYSALRRVETRSLNAWAWIGRHSYSLFLVHHPMILYLVPSDGGLLATLTGSAGALVFTVLVSIVLDGLVASAFTLFSLDRPTASRAALPIVIVSSGLIILSIGADLLIRATDPQEVLGWGERPSMERHRTFGWRLKPSQETRLRWESYDYYVRTNSLGFPGPEYPQKKGGAFRILTIGDAFTSAEGVDTEKAWPRLIEVDLAARLPNRRVEVMNFAVTGYGPNQYAAVAAQFVPLYRPDVIIVGFFVNEFEDVLESTEAFRESIGFHLPPQDGWQATLRLAHLCQFLKRRVGEPLYEILRGQPAPHRYFLGQFAALERNHSDRQLAARRAVTERFRSIKDLADSVGARLLLALIPAPVQVCHPEELSYYPRYVDLHDTARFDLDLPQRITTEIADELHIAITDLRPVLASAPGGCPYQPMNLHWTATGHRIVAKYLATYLISNAYARAHMTRSDTSPCSAVSSPHG